MDREQVLKWARDSGAEPMRGALEHCEFWCEYRVLERFARLVRNAALNEAVNECFAVDNTGDYLHHNRDDCANGIDALKEPQP